MNLNIIKEALLMIRKVLIFTALIFGLIILAGCTQPVEEAHETYAENKTNGTNITNETSALPIITIGPCNSTDRREVDMCLLNNSMCADIASDDVRDECYYNGLNCTAIHNESFKSECEIKVKLMECEMQSEDINLCKALATHDPLHCGANADCVLRYANKSGDESACRLLSDYSATACRAVAANDYGMCYSELQYDATKKECLKLFAQYTGKDGNICNNISSHSYKEDCYKGVAEATADYSNCLLIETYNLHKECLLNVAVQTADHTICNLTRLAYSTAVRNQDVNFCMTMVATAHYKPQYCQDVYDAKYKWECFGNSIVDGKVKKEDCDQIDKALYKEWSEECYKRVAETET